RGSKARHNHSARRRAVPCRMGGARAGSLALMERHFVATGYVVRDGKTLLLYHKKLKMWLPPGGHIDEGELPEEAVLREIREETGLEAEVISPRRQPHPADGEPALSEREHDGMRWYSIEQLQDGALPEEVRISAAEAIRVVSASDGRK